MPLTPTELLYVESKTGSKLLNGNYKCRVAVVFISETPGWNTLFRICSGDVDVSVSQNIETTPTVWSNLRTSNTAVTLGMETRVRFNSPKQVGRNTSSLIDVLEDCEGLVLVYDVMDWIGFRDLPIYSAYTSHGYHSEGPGASSKDVRQEEQKPHAFREATNEPHQKQEIKIGQKTDAKPQQKQKRSRMMQLRFKGSTERTIGNKSIPDTKVPENGLSQRSQLTTHTLQTQQTSPKREKKPLNTVGTSHTSTTSGPIFPRPLAQPGPFPVAVVADSPANGAYVPWAVPRNQGEKYAKSVGATFHVVSAEEAKWGDYDIMDDLAGRILLRRAFDITRLSSEEWDEWIFARRTCTWPR